MKQFDNGVKILLGSLSIAILAGCAPSMADISVQRYGDAHFAPTAEIQTLRSFPQARYTRIARLEITGAPGQDHAQIMSLLLKKSEALGANALVIISEQSEPMNGSSPATYNPSGGSYQITQTVSAIHVVAEAIKIE